MEALARIFHLGVKELRSLKSDPIMLVLIVYSFTFAIYAVATGAKMEVENAAVAVVDEDRSTLSSRIRDAFLPPYFKPAPLIGADAIDEAMDQGRTVFVVEIPPQFERDVLAGRRPAMQINIDATAMSQAGNGAAYIKSIIIEEVNAALPAAARTPEPIDLVIRSLFNPNLDSLWFGAHMQIANNITILAIILSGAALIRERERGTIDHLMVMPVKPLEIMAAKIWSNGLVILAAAALSLVAVIEGLLGVPTAGSVALFVAAGGLYLFSVTALGIMVATLTSSMAQFGLLLIPLLVILMLLSGGATPIESMPAWLRTIMQVATPTPHFVALSQAILSRGAGLRIVWPDMAALVAIGLVYTAVALMRFRRMLANIR